MDAHPAVPQVFLEDFVQRLVCEQTGTLVLRCAYPAMAWDHPQALIAECEGDALITKREAWSVG